MVGWLVIALVAGNGLVVRLGGRRRRPPSSSVSVSECECQSEGSETKSETKS